MPSDPSAQRTSRISVSLTEDTRTRLDELASETGLRSVSLVVSLLLERAIAEIGERPLTLGKK